MPEPIYCGSYVRNRLTGIVGRVHNKYARCPYSDEGLARRDEALGPNPMRFVNDQWFQILEHAGSTSHYAPHHALPESLLEKIEPFNFKNSEARSYFSDMYNRSTGGVRRAPQENYEYPTRRSTWI